MTWKFVLFYQPPCGTWYVHSHKLYDTEADAIEAAKKFLCANTPIYTMPVPVATFENYAKTVGTL